MHEEGRLATAGAVARSGGTRPAWSGGTRPPVSDAERVSVRARRTGATDHRCDCGYEISTSPPFPRCPMCGGHGWRLIAGTRARPPRLGDHAEEVLKLYPAATIEEVKQAATDLASEVLSDRNQAIKNPA